MNFRPPSLPQLFEPPAEYQGVFGWVCGYSADASFLADAIERFSGLTQAQRRYQGKVMLALMLDPGNPQIVPTDVPGVLHLPVRSPEWPFLLLHAKLAVLGFQSSDHFLLRAIVTTGNWTRQTLEESLDLAWHIDVASKPAGKTKEVLRQERTDLSAIWSFMSWLRLLFDTRGLNLLPEGENESAAAAERVSTWATQLARQHRGYRPRFFDNRTKSLIQQLPDLVRSHAGGVARNYLALGSGFYESVESGLPGVPDSVFGILQKERLLTATTGKNLFVNPIACQAVAKSRPWLEKRGWLVRAPRVPAYFGALPRALHAKFIFSANERSGSDRCSSPWLYLGSGNLTIAGFKQRAGPTGNLEAGVILAPSTFNCGPASLHWEKDRRIEDASVVTNLLPIHYDDEDVSLPPLQPGCDMPLRGIAFTAAPVPLMLWDETGRRLVPVGESTVSFCVLDPAGQPCERQEDGSFNWPAVRPRQVRVAWSTEGLEYTCEVPVIDSYGRFCATEFSSIDLEDAWIQLANFPMPPDDEEITEGDAQDVVDGVATTEAVHEHVSMYPVRRMMTLVEDIAAKQTGIARADWSMWCNRLEQVLIQAKDSPVVTAFRSIRLNPLHPLLHTSFRPAFAATPATSEGARYELTLSRVTQAWEVQDYPALGATS